MTLTNCAECGKEVSTLASACPHCGCPVVASPKAAAPTPRGVLYGLSRNVIASPKEAAPIPEGQPTANPPPPPPTVQSITKLKTEKNTSKGCLGCLSIVILLGLIGGIADEVGCNDSSKTSSTSVATDPNIRHIGVNGAVLGYDSNGLANRLSPGTTVRRTGTTANGQQVYAVVDGQWAGALVPLSESDLEPQ